MLLTRNMAALPGRGSVKTCAISDSRPSGGAAGRLIVPILGNPTGPVRADALGENPTSGSGRPGGRGGEGRAAPGLTGEASATDTSVASFRSEVSLDRPAGGALRTAPGGDNGGPGSPSSNGTGGGPNGGHGGSSGGGRFDPGSVVPWLFVYAGLCGFAYLGNNILSKPKVAAAPAPTADVAPAVRPCCAGKAK